MRHLTPNEIERLAARKAVRRIAVVNFLATMGDDSHAAWENLRADTACYRWNAATVKAISDGIARASRPALVAA